MSGLEPSVALLYPDIMRAGSLGVVLDEDFADAGSSLRSYPSSSTRDAQVMSGTRRAHVTIGAVKRQFHLSITENQGEQVEMASGWTLELSEVAAAIRSVLENGDHRVSDLVRGFSFLELKPFALSWERGTYIEDHWQSFLTESAPSYDERAVEQPLANGIFHWDDLAELIRQASERPELRRRMPFTSLHRFSVRASEPSATVPVIWPLGGGRFALTPYRDGTTFAKGSASVVLDALIDQVSRVDKQARRGSP